MADAEKLVRPKELGNWAYETIKESILNRRVAPCEQLRIEDMARRMNISRTPIREALIRLEREGLVRINSRVGFFVCELTQNDLRELFELRELTEGYAAEKAAPSLSEEDLAQIDDLHRNAVSAFERNDLTLFNQYEIALHDFIIGHSGNMRLSRMIEGLKDLTYRERQYALSSRENVAQSIQEHRLLIEALHGRDGGQAGRLMRLHLRNVRDRLQRILDFPSEDERGARKH